MRKIVTAAMVSLDGVMQAPGGPDEDPTGGFAYGGWVAPYFDEALGAAADETFSAPFDLLLGRRTYDIFAAYWPYVQHDPAASDFDQGMSGIGRRFDEVTKYVATHSPDTLTWRNSQALGQDVVARLRDLKRSNGPILLTQGSCELIQTLLAEDLIDELRLQVFPLVLGKGKRLFGDGTLPGALRLTRSATSPSGTLIVSYERAGAVKPGSFAMENPTEAELARRARMEESAKP
jgi:dihydrofolate reductase